MLTFSMNFESFLKKILTKLLYMHMQYPYDDNVLKSVIPLLQYALKNYPL